MASLIIKEEPPEESLEGHLEAPLEEHLEAPLEEPLDWAPSIAIASVAGNADDQWGLHSTLDLGVDVKVEQQDYGYEESEEEEEGEVDAGADYSCVEPEPAESRESPEIEMLQVPPAPVREIEVVDLEAEWDEREGASTLRVEHPRADPPAPRAAVKAERSPSPEPACSRAALPVALPPRVKGERSPPSRDPRVRVKQERVLDEEAGRAQMFGRQQSQQFPDDDAGEVVADEDKQAEEEQRGPGRSTTLYPAVCDVEKMRAHVVSILDGYKKKRTECFGEAGSQTLEPRRSRSPAEKRAAAHKSRRSRSPIEKRPSTSSETPRRSQSPAEKRRRNLDDATPPKRAKRDASPPKRVKRDSSSPPKGPKRDASPRPSSKPGRAEDPVKRDPSPGTSIKGVKKALGPAPASVKKRRMLGVDVKDIKEEPLDEPLSPPPAPAPKVKKGFAGPASAKRRKLPVLPASATSSLSPLYDGRSPLNYMDDDAPRKSYSAGPTETSESKGVVRAHCASWLENVLYPMSKWKPEWLQESKGVSKKKVPTLLPNMDIYDTESKVIEFDSVENYINHFQNGLLLELWETLRKEAKTSKPFTTAVDSHYDKVLLKNKRRRTLTCHCGTDLKSPFRPGELVVVASPPRSSEAYFKPYFAYMEVVSRSKVVSDSVKLSSVLQDYFETEPCFKASFKLTVCTDDTPETVPKVFSLTKLRNVYEEVELFKFLYDFQVHNMAPLILKPLYSPRPEPAFGLKTGGDLHPLAQKPVLLSVIQDIVDYEAPSLSVVEGGPGTGKTYLVAALAQELVERKHKLHRDCYVVIAAKSNNQLGLIMEKLNGRNNFSTEDPKNRDPDAFRAVWLGNDQSPIKGADNLKRHSLRKLGEKHLLKQSTEPLELERKKLMRDIAKNESKLSKLSKKNYNFPTMSSDTAKKKLQLTLLNEKIEKSSSQAKDENVAYNTILEKCDIILTTFSCTFYRSTAQEALKKGHQRKHKVLIIDDASEVGEPTIIKMMVLFGITDVVLFGDTKQHTPYVSSKWARNAGLVVPLMKRYTQALKDEQSLPLCRSLTRQIRLHPDLLRGINRIFYNNAMKPSNQYKKYIAEGYPFRPYVWFNCTYFENKYKDEADFATKLLAGITRKLQKQRISFVSLSKDINARLASTEFARYCDLADNISSVECDVVVLSLGPSTRLRVDKTICALTRARKSLFICGNLQDPNKNIVALFKDARNVQCTEDVTDGDITVETLLSKISI